VLVLDESAFARLPLPLANPERVILITRQDRQSLARAWNAGVSTVVSPEDSPATVLLAIMAVALRNEKSHRSRQDLYSIRFVRPQRVKTNHHR